MKCFLTGATGFIGSRLAEALIAGGHETRCLVRQNGKLSFPGSDKAIIVTGDLDDNRALDNGTDGCDVVFHLAAYARQWSKDPALPYHINVEGTVNVLEAASRQRVRKFVLTSTAGVLGPSGEEGALDETSIRTAPFTVEYERTKAEANARALAYSQKGIEVMIVYPTRVFGPGPINESNSLTKIISLYTKGKWRVIPGDGSKSGNFVFVEDVVSGHILAATRGRPGGQYILGGENHSWEDFFRTLAIVSGQKRMLVKLPPGIMLTAAWFLELQACVTGIPPRITVPFVRKYNDHSRLSSAKAMQELGYKPVSLEAGIKQTLLWLQAKDSLKR